MLDLSDADLLAEIARTAPDPTRRARVLLERVVERNVRALQMLTARRPALQFAYSVKTNPDERIMRTAAAAGIHAEVISPQELLAAKRCGFGERTIYNGPVPAWRAPDAPGIVFSDSIEAYSANASRLHQTLVGIRVRPAGVPSRFGVPWERSAALERAIVAQARSEIAVSFHVRPEDYGGRTWREIVAAGLAFAASIESHTQAQVVAFDVGGGKTPAQFDAAVDAGDFDWMVDEVQLVLPHVRTCFAEPGQAVVTPAAFVIAPVLEVRREGARRSVVVDAGYPDLPQIGTFPHRVLCTIDEELVVLPPGNDRILGCTCLEYDIVRDGVRLPARIDRLDAIVIADAGAYDTSMGFDFARAGNKRFDDGIQAGAGELHPADSSEGHAARSRAG